MSVKRYLDTVAAERRKTDWTAPSKHPLSGFAQCFGADRRTDMARQLQQRQLDRMVAGR